MLCLWVCKPCRHWKEDEDKKDFKSIDDKGLDVKLKMKLKNDKLKEFIIENMLVFMNDNQRIGYIALDNKDRLEKPGEILIEFDHRPTHSLIDYKVRMLIYDDED